MRLSRHILPALLLLAGCAGGLAVSDTPVRIGRPYSVRGVTYVPAAAPGYEAVGYASWYGNESGSRTANGERFRAKAVTGAHPTLPLRSYVEVTALDTDHTALVRINDLSRGAARALGVTARGSTPVRICVVAPGKGDTVLLQRGRAARPRPDATPADLASWRTQLLAGYPH